MSTKLILSAVETQNGEVNVHIKRFIYDELCDEQNTLISFRELFDGFVPGTSMEEALYYVYILDEQINCHLELEPFEFEIHCPAD